MDYDSAVAERHAVSERLASLDVVVKGLERRLYGNGQPGDIAEIKEGLNDLRAWYWKAMGGIAVIAVLAQPVAQLINYAIHLH